MRLLILLISFTISLLLTLSCDSATGPEEPPPGRRDYVWEVDTLKIPYNLLSQMWGSSINDVWAVGPGGDLDKTIFHFDGDEWKTDGISRPISPDCIWGTSSQNVFIGGQNGRIWNFDGVDWKESIQLEDEVSGNLYITQITGINENTVFACGFNWTENSMYLRLYKFTNLLWTELSIPEIKAQPIKIEIEDEKNVFIYALYEFDYPERTDSAVIFFYDGEKLHPIYSAKYYTDVPMGLLKLGDNVFITFGTNIYDYKDSKLVKVRSVNDNQFEFFVEGRSLNDIFFINDHDFKHYNGINTKTLYSFENPIVSTCGSLFKNEVIFLMIDYYGAENIFLSGHLE